jgi:serine/threonine-protein kinase
LTGRAVFDAPSLLQLGAIILEKDPPSLRSILPDAPAELETIIARCLAKDPAQRFETVADLAIALYPFGPRRARISAERCYYLLKNSSATRGELELQSHPPPSNTAANSAPANAEAVPSGSPAAISVGKVPQPKRGGWKTALFAAALVLVAAGGYGAARLHPAAGDTSASATIAHFASDVIAWRSIDVATTHAGALMLPSNATVPLPSPTVAPPTPEPATASLPEAAHNDSPAPAAASSSAHALASVKRVVRVDASKPKRAAKSAHGDEPDVGF